MRFPMAPIRAYVDETCPLDGYGDLSVRVMASATDREWRAWAESNLGDPNCEACLALNQTDEQASPSPPPSAGARTYCETHQAARQKFGQSIVLLYGPRLLDHDIATPEQALALFDDDDALPAELVVWLFMLPRLVRERRIGSLAPNWNGS